MYNNYFNSFQKLFSTCFILMMLSGGVSGQLILEREFVGAVAATSTQTSNGSSQQLQVDASFGQTMIGYEEGDIVITIGFHQQGELGAGRNIDNRIVTEDEEDETTSEEVVVNAYPNPTISSLTVDLGPFHEKLKELRLVDIYGRTVITRRVESERQITISQLHDLPNSNYFLQGVTDSGQLHQLSTVMIIKE